MQKITIAAIFVAALVVVAVTLASTSRSTDSCATLLPKGGGTVVHGVFVPLDPGEYLRLCTR